MNYFIVISIATDCENCARIEMLDNWLTAELRINGIRLIVEIKVLSLRLGSVLSRHWKASAQSESETLTISAYAHRRRMPIKVLTFYSQQSIDVWTIEPLRFSLLTRHMWTWWWEEWNRNFPFGGWIVCVFTWAQSIRMPSFNNLRPDTNRKCNNNSNSFIVGSRYPTVWLCPCASNTHL